MKYVYLLAFGLLVSPAAFANTYVKCAKQASLDNAPDVVGYELELSSEGSDRYEGPVGGSWNMKLRSESSPWLSRNANVIAKSSRQGGNVVVEITIKHGQGATGAVGTKYRLIDLYNDEPVLEKYTMGGFAGQVKVGTFQCFSGND